MSAGYERAAPLATKFLMTESQAAILLAQMTRMEDLATTREQNALYLTSLLKEIPGILPLRRYDGCTGGAYLSYKFRYKKEQFAGLPRTKFRKAMAAEGIPAGSGYTPLNKKQYLKNCLKSKGYQLIYPKDVLARWEERNQCPANDRLCEEAAGFTQNLLLGPRSDMDQIAEAVMKIQAHAAELARA